jgi:hypothetical protein
MFLVVLSNLEGTPPVPDTLERSAREMRGDSMPFDPYRSLPIRDLLSRKLVVLLGEA